MKDCLAFQEKLNKWIHVLSHVKNPSKTEFIHKLELLKGLIEEALAPPYNCPPFHNEISEAMKVLEKQAPLYFESFSISDFTEIDEVLLNLKLPLNLEDEVRETLKDIEGYKPLKVTFLKVRAIRAEKSAWVKAAHPEKLWRWVRKNLIKGLHNRES